jgi:hypothetical protein
LGCWAKAEPCIARQIEARAFRAARTPCREDCASRPYRTPAPARPDMTCCPLRASSWRPAVRGTAMPLGRQFAAADTRDGYQALDTPEADPMCGGERRGRGAGAVGGDQVGAGALVEAVSQAPRPLGCRCGGGGDGVRSRRVDGKSQVSGLRGVRVRGEHLHRSERVARGLDGFGRLALCIWLRPRVVSSCAAVAGGCRCEVGACLADRGEGDVMGAWIRRSTGCRCLARCAMRSPGSDGGHRRWTCCELCWVMNRTKRGSTAWPRWAVRTPACSPSRRSTSTGWTLGRRGGIASSW